MLIDLDFEDDYTINRDIILPSTYYKDSEIHSINHLHIDGKLYYDSDSIIHAVFQVTGEMIIPDSISLEEVSYPFSIQYDDILEESYKNDENKLDLFEFLWENIVLEIPLKFTKVQDLSKFHGDGWKLISDEDRNSSSNPFSDLLKNFDKKE